MLAWAEFSWGTLKEAPSTRGTGSFLGVESGRAVTLTPHPLLLPRFKNRLELYLYSPKGPSWLIKKKGETYPTLKENSTSYGVQRLGLTS